MSRVLFTFDPDGGGTLNEIVEDLWQAAQRAGETELAYLCYRSSCGDPTASSRVFEVITACRRWRQFRRSMSLAIGAISVVDEVVRNATPRTSRIRGHLLELEKVIREVEGD